MTNLRLDTVEGQIPLGEDFDDEADGHTVPITTPTELSPDVMRYIDAAESRHRRELASAEARIVETIAADLESVGRGFSVLMGTHAAAARVRSMQALRPRGAP